MSFFIHYFAISGAVSDISAPVIQYNDTNHKI